MPQDDETIVGPRRVQHDQFYSNDMFGFFSATSICMLFKANPKNYFHFAHVESSFQSPIPVKTVYYKIYSALSSQKNKMKFLVKPDFFF